METRSYQLSMEGIVALVSHRPATIGQPREANPLDWERKNFREYLYQDSAGQLVIPARNIKRMLLDACPFCTEMKPRGTKSGWAKFVEGALLVQGDALLDTAIEKVVPFEAVVCTDPSSKQRPKGLRVRPLIAAGWHASTSLLVFHDVLTDAFIEMLCEKAGLHVGILSGRRIDMGRFQAKVTKA